MTGSVSSLPTTGARLRNAITTGKKSPKRLMKPNTSIPIPITGLPSRTMAMPRKKKTDAFAFRLWKKNRTDRVGPIMSITPARYNTLPMASRPLSKNKVTPRRVNASPKAVSPMPIFRTSVMANGEDISVSPRWQLASLFRFRSIAWLGLCRSVVLSVRAACFRLLRRFTYGRSQWHARLECPTFPAPRCNRNRYHALQ